MSKSKKAAKRKAQEVAGHDSRKRCKGPPSPESSEGTDHDEPKTLNSIISEEEVELAVETLQSLAKHPAIIKTKACREIRTAVYDFRSACTTGINTTVDTNLTAKISAAIVDEKYVDALVLLAEMRLRNESPKLGALCRWVRDIDVTSGFSAGTDVNTGTIVRSKDQLKRLRLLDAISRVTGTADLDPSISWTQSSDPFILHPEWMVGTRSITNNNNKGEGHKERVCSTVVAQKFRILERTKGAQRKPPNLHDAVLYLSEENTIPLLKDSMHTTYHKHPSVPHLSIMKDVLSTDECRSIVDTMETVGFLPDAPIRDDGMDSSILAHNVYWVVDQAFHDTLWNRVRPFIPAEMEGKRARGINRRFRVYRYVPGAEYRVHFDGAWPPSGISSTGEYQWDSSPANAKQSSLFTFLVYLNDDFEGGETTFFTPSLVEGVMNAHPVRPIMGSIALFPHGDSKGALLHEGTGVRKGVKYIIRTDVEYDVNPSE